MAYALISSGVAPRIETDQEPTGRRCSGAVRVVRTVDADGAVNLFLRGFLKVPIFSSREAALDTPLDSSPGVSPGESTERREFPPAYSLPGRTQNVEHGPQEDGESDHPMNPVSLHISPTCRSRWIVTGSILAGR